MKASLKETLLSFIRLMNQIRVNSWRLGSLLALSLVSLIALPGNGAEQERTVGVLWSIPANFEWSMISRFGADRKTFTPGLTIDAPDGLIDYDYSLCYLHPDAHGEGCPTHPWVVTFDAGSSWLGMRYNWEIDGDRQCDVEPTGKKEVPDPFVDPQKVTCRFATQGTYRVTLRVKNQVGAIGSTTRLVKVKDLLMVSIGDSVASGEGNPDRERKIVTCGSRLEDCIEQLRELGATQWQLDRVKVGVGPNSSHSVVVPAQWQDQRCHRSAFAGPAMAAKVIENTYSHTSVTFLHLACSGAGISEGLINGYKGLDPTAPRASGLQPAVDGKLPAQIKEVIKLLCAREFIDGACVEGDKPFPIRNIDILLLIVGANDINFGDAAIACAALEHCGSLAANPPIVGGAYAAEAAALIQDVAVVDNLLPQLPGKYDTLKAGLEGIPNLRRDHVFFTEYFDPTHSEHGNFCNTFSRVRDYAGRQYGLFKVNLGDLLSLPPYVEYDGITSDESKWAFNMVLTPLNRIIHDATTRFGWNYVGGIKSAFRHHGLCSPSRWVNLLKDSMRRQGDLKGPLHPNLMGHNQYLDSIFNAVEHTVESAEWVIAESLSSLPSDHHKRISLGSNKPPIANAGTDQVVRLDSSVKLDGVRSFDPDSGPKALSFSWEQTAGPALLVGPTQVNRSFTVTPTVEGTYIFSLVVFDGRDFSVADDVKIVAPLLGDFDGDEDVDLDDRALLRDAVNKKASGPNDILDLDGDGLITRNDELELSRQCTRARCATE